MKKINIFIFLLVILAVVVAGCNDSEIVFSEEYVWGKDHQLNFRSSPGEGVCMAESLDGLYFFSGPQQSFIYFYDKSIGKARPLCNKPQCLHDYEPDPQRITQCNAVKSTFSPFNFLHYNDDKLYYTSYREVNEDKTVKLHRMSLDGTGERELYQFRQLPTQLIVHRGSAFFVTSDNGTIAGKEDKTKTTYGLYKLDLNKSQANPVLLTEGQNIHGSYGKLFAYGNYIYFYESFFPDPLMETARNITYYRYNILTEEKELLFEENTINNLTVLNDMLAYTYISKEGTYISDIDRQNEQKVSETKGILVANSNYLFIDTVLDDLIVARTGGKKSNRRIVVIDKDGHEISSISLDDSYSQMLDMFGCNDEGYYIYDRYQENEFDQIKRVLLFRIEDMLKGINIPEVIHEFVPNTESKGFYWPN